MVMSRKAAIEFLTSNGFNMDQVGMLSKNSTKEKVLSRHYVTQLPNDVLKCVAGFKKNEPYNVPRTKLLPPSGYTWDQLVPFLFPEAQRWKEELEGENGDDCRSSTKFFSEILPFLAMVVMQDGVLWTELYPQNSASQLLKTMKFCHVDSRGNNVEQTYLQYALAGREQIRTEVAAIVKEQEQECESVNNIARIEAKLDKLLELYMNKDATDGQQVEEVRSKLRGLENIFSRYKSIIFFFFLLQSDTPRKFRNWYLCK
jgi:hypothetical protein